MQQQSYVMKNGTVKYWCWFKCEQYPTPFSVQCAAGYSSNVLTLKVKVTILTKHFQSYQHQRKKTNSNQTIVSYLFSFSRRKIVDVAFCLTLMCLLVWSHKKKKTEKLSEDNMTVWRGNPSDRLPPPHNTSWSLKRGPAHFEQAACYWMKKLKSCPPKTKWCMWQRKMQRLGRNNRWNSFFSWRILFFQGCNSKLLFF